MKGWFGRYFQVLFRLYQGVIGACAELGCFVGLMDRACWFGTHRICGKVPSSGFFFMVNACTSGTDPILLYDLFGWCFKYVFKNHSMFQAFEFVGDRLDYNSINNSSSRSLLHHVIACAGCCSVCCPELKVFSHLSSSICCPELKVVGASLALTSGPPKDLLYQCPYRARNSARK